MTKPLAQIKFSVELEIEYDPFQGRTPEQFAEVVHDDLIDSLWEMRNGSVQGLFTFFVGSGDGIRIRYGF